jgi:acyl dehydratase
MPMLSDHLEKWSEKVLGKVTSFTLGMIDPLWSQRYAAAIDDLDPLYFDDAYAREHGYKGIIAPPNYLATLRGDQGPGPFESELLEDGTHPDGRPEVPGLQIMGGGQELDFRAPVYCGERIFGEKRIASIEQQQGRQGQMVIVAEEIRYRNEEGEEKLVMRNRSLYRFVNQGASDDS